ncbi:hypothetical protein [Methyloversatilis discipulorum]|uniref:hypothetical protein n=1 Tax=Methyloversatilis discipulorum TaxID=1119528 RepID=UPI00047FE9AA|nr:hypothetical protein [Methyloversatilis discipulorum]
MSSLPDRLRGFLLALTLAAMPLAAGAAFELRFDRLSAAAITLDDVHVEATALDGGRARVRAARAQIAGHTLQQVQLDCADFSALPEQRCRGGVLRARGYGPWPLEFSVRGAQRVLDANVRFSPDLRVTVGGALAGASPHLALQAKAVDIARLLALEPALQSLLKDYAPAGRADIEAVLKDFGAARSPHVEASLLLTDARFASADGLRAAEGMSLALALDATRQGEDWLGRASIDWRAGELLWDSIYLKGGGTTLASDFALTAGGLELRAGTLDLAGVGRLNLEALFARSPATLTRARVEGRSFDLDALNTRFVEPLFAARGWSTFAAAGRADLVAEFDPQGATAATLHLTNAAVADKSGRWSLDGVTAFLPWRRDEPTEPHAVVKSAHFDRLPFGAFELKASVAADRVSLEPVRIPVLDAGLRLNLLDFQRADGRWRGDLSFDLEPVSMPELSEALGLPRMAGSLGASVPHVSWRDGVLSLDGQLLIRVFDGYVAATGLRVIEPLGTTPRVLADLQMRYIDLEALTDTVKFGRVTGRLDGDVKGLELLRWRPVAFAAHIRSSEGDYPRVISQRAVQNITALGGPGAAAAIQRSFLGFFERFGYRRIGLSCVLRDGVCNMDGIAPRGDGFMLIEGGGIPALSVVGYNRRVDWPELIERLRRVTDAKPVVK